MRENPMSVDPFSDFLTLLETRSVLSGALQAGGHWAIRFPATDRLKFWGVLRGRCMLLLEGEAEAISVEAGDIFLLRCARAHVLATDPALPPMPLDEILVDRMGALARHGSGDEFLMIGGKVELALETAGVLLDALPALIHLRAGNHCLDAAHWLLRRLAYERDGEAPGAVTASAQLAHLLFIEILRAATATGQVAKGGWLPAIADARLAPAIRLMHADPARAWTLDELASAAAMSRAAFAARFKNVAGLAPMAYLTAWRMRLAQRALRERRVPLATLAQSLGYGSESAFSNAYKRTLGHAPTMHRSVRR